MSIRGRIQSLLTRLFRAFATFIIGSCLTAILSVAIGANLTIVAGFFGGGIAGYVLCTYFAKLDDRQLRKMFDVLGIEYTEGTLPANYSVPGLFRGLFKFRAIVTFVVSSALIAVLSVALGASLVTGFLGGGIAGYLLGRYFAKRDHQQLRKIFDELGIEYTEATSRSEYSSLAILKLKLINFVIIAVIVIGFITAVFLLDIKDWLVRVKPLILTLVVIAALFAIVSGVWVAIALISAITGRQALPSSPPQVNEQDPAGQEPRSGDQDI